MKALNDIMAAIQEGERAAAEAPAEILVERIRAWVELAAEAVRAGDVADAMFYAVASGAGSQRARLLAGGELVDRQLRAEVIG